MTSRITGAARSRSRLEIFAFAVIATLVTAGLLIVVLRQFGYGLEYDEAYLLHVVKNLAEGRGYVDDGVSFQTSGAPFEPRISTGPTVLLPSAVMWWLSGGAIAVVRLIPLLYFGLLIAAVAWLFHRAGGAWAALAALLGLLAMPVLHPDLQNTSLMPGRFVGELPATALLVTAAALLVARRSFAAGLVAGLAVLTKLVFLLPVLVLLATWIAWALLRSRRETWTIPLQFLPGVMIPLAVFELVKVVSLGWDGYLVHRQQVSDFLVDQGIEPQSADRILNDKLDELSFLTSRMTLVVLAIAVILLVVLATRRGALRRARLLERPWVSVYGLALGSLAAIAWWLFQSAQTSGRPALPSVLLLTVVAFGLLGHLATRVAQEFSGTAIIQALAVGAWLVMAGIVGYRVVDMATDRSGADLLAAQEGAARALADELGFVPRDDYWTHPDLLLLSGLPSQPYDSVDPPVAVITSLQSRIEDGGSDAPAAADRCRLVYFESRDVLVCRVPWGTY